MHGRGEANMTTTDVKADELSLEEAGADASRPNVVK
jgi:hypothetical protein